MIHKKKINDYILTDFFSFVCFCPKVRIRMYLMFFVHALSRGRWNKLKRIKESRPSLFNYTCRVILMSFQMLYTPPINKPRETVID